MSNFIVVRSEAQEEIEAASDWYEDKSEGLGLEFLRSVDASMAAIQRFPTSYATIYKQVRRALLRRFPYGLLYFLDEDRIVIIACFHASRNPNEWQQRLN